MSVEPPRPPGGTASGATASASIDRGTAALGLLTVVLANVRYLAGLRDLLDPLVSMEPFYIRMAQLPTTSILRESPSWGPLYALWIKPFVAALGDPLAVYGADVWALSLAVSTAIYLHLLLLTRRTTVAVVVALLYLVSDANAPLAGKVSSFALLVLLAGWTLAGLATGARRGAAAAVAAVVASYARPEIYPAALGLCLLALWQAWRERPRRGAVMAWPAAAVAITVALALAVGTPVLGPTKGGDRLFEAFREHFAWNWATWNGQWRYFQAVWQSEFGDANGIIAAARANPTAVVHHLVSNLVGSVRFLLGDAFRHFPLLAPADSRAGVAGEAWVVAVAAYGALGIVAARPMLRRQMRARYGGAVLCYAAVSALCLAAATIIYPRQHYLVIPSVLALLAGALAFTLITPEPATRRWPVRLFAAAACLAAVPRPFVLPSAYAVPDAPYAARITVDRPVTDTIAFLRALSLPPPVRVLTLTDGIGDLLGPGYEEVKIWQKGAQPLQDYLRDQHVDVIVALRLEHDSFVVDDPYWLRIQLAPEETGFTRLPVPGHDTVGVFVRATLKR